MRYAAPARALLACVVGVAAVAPGCYIKADSGRILRATHVVVEVGYASGAEPTTMSGDTPWPLLRTQLARVFRRSNPTFDFRAPVLLTDVPAKLTGQLFSYSDAVDYAKHERTVASAGDTAAFYVLILPGYFDTDTLDAGLAKDKIHYGTTDVGEGITVLSFAAVDSDVVDARYEGPDYYGLTADDAGSMVEQLVMTHEIGHAIGLVDSGVSMVHDHYAPGGHCSTTTCIMAPDLDLVVNFHRVALDPTTIVFDDACLADVDGM